MERMIRYVARAGRRPPLAPASPAVDIAEWLAPFSAIARGVLGNRRSALTVPGGLLDGPEAASIACERHAGIKAGPVNAILVAVLLRTAPHDPRFFLAHAAALAPFDRSLAMLRARAEREVGLAELESLLPRWRELADEALSVPGVRGSATVHAVPADAELGVAIPITATAPTGGDALDTGTPLAGSC